MIHTSEHSADAYGTISDGLSRRLVVLRVRHHHANTHAVLFLSPAEAHELAGLLDMAALTHENAVAQAELAAYDPPEFDAEDEDSLPVSACPVGGWVRTSWGEGWLTECWGRPAGDKICTHAALHVQPRCVQQVRGHGAIVRCCEHPLDRPGAVCPDAHLHVDTYVENGRIVVVSA